MGKNQYVIRLIQNACSQPAGGTCPNHTESTAVCTAAQNSHTVSMRQIYLR